MEVTILEDERTAISKAGEKYQIVGVEITRSRTGVKVFYDMATSFARHVLAKNTRHHSHLNDRGMLVIT